ncbi:hypothetical protein FrCorBMG51_17670 [Protofrankia coriariae]|uniref:Serine protease n=1 Tax=Protofrankia coriariae TaxID=1562887 RepID=A0ABR5F1B3_9ACTN|nr:hypothetical protein FrCorBMG51_17670 [Protofrankia coriariae]
MPGGYAPAAGYPLTGAPQAGASDFYGEQTRLAPGARPFGPPPVDSAPRAGEPYREVPRPQAPPGASGGPQPGAAGSRQAGRYQPGAPYPPDPLPLDGPAAGEMTVFTDLRSRKGSDRPGRPDGVPPPRTRQVGADTSTSTSRRPGPDHSDDRRAGPSAAEQDTTGEQVGTLRAESGRRRDDRGDPRSPDRSASRSTERSTERSTDRSTGDAGTRRNRPRDAAGLPWLLRRLVYAVVILGVAFAVGGGAGFVWQKISGGGGGGAAAVTARPPAVRGVR